MQIQSYPHITIDVEDKSIFIPTPSQELPLFRPLYFLRTAERGPLDIPTWCSDINVARERYGAKTFDSTSNYYSRESEYLIRTFQSSGAFIVRVAPNGDDSEPAKTAALVVEAQVADTDIPQYQTDAEGNIIYDSSGNPLTIGSGISGIEIVWTVRPLQAGEDPEDVQTTTTTVSGVNYTSYPMFVFHTPYPGAFGNNAGFSFYYDSDENDPDQFNRIGAPLYTLAPVEVENGTTNAVRDVFKAVNNSFILKPNVVDPSTLAPMSIDAVLQRAYEGRLPYLITSYNENFKAVGDLLIQKEQAEAEYISWVFTPGAATYTTVGETTVGSETVELTDVSGIEVGMAVDDDVDGIPLGTTVADVDTGTNTITLSQPTASSAIPDATSITIDEPFNHQPESEFTDGWQINIVSGTNPETDVPYQRLNVRYEHDDLLSGLGSKYSIMKPLKDINYKLKGGQDGEYGDIHNPDAYYSPGGETKIRQLLEGSLLSPDGSYANLEDPSRFPFNYVFDVGYALDTKQALIDFQGIRGDVRSSIGCYVPGESNDKITNISTGIALREYALLQMESTLKGTHACRTSIWTQSGKPVNSTSKLWYPATLWDAQVHAEFQNRKFLDRVPEGLPNSAVDIFREWNWLPLAEDTKRRFWNEGLNYAQYYDMTNLHFPAVRTVYDYETSVLINNTFVDAIVYAKQALRYIWHKYTGVSIPFADLAESVEADATAAIQRIFNQKYDFDISVYQTDFERQLGYVAHILLDITAPGTTRVFRVDIVTNRENFEG